MENRLTKALGLGDIDNLAEYERISQAILEDNFLFKKVVELLVVERGPEAITYMHPVEVDAFQKRVGFIRKNPALRVEWVWLPKYQTEKGEKPMVRMRRYVGGNKQYDEQAFWSPTREFSVAQFSALSWFNSRPPQDVIAAFECWLKQPDEEVAAELRHQELMTAEAQQKKQGRLTGDIAAAVNVQRGAGHE